MHQLRHFIKVDTHSRNKKCVNCGTDMPPPHLFPSDDLIITRRTGRGITTRREELCNNCYRSMPSQKLIRGEPPEYIAQKLTRREKRELMGTDTP